MSLPEFPTPDPCLTREKAINMILVSIAMEEMALSHVIEAESEKIKYALDYRQNQNCCADLDQVLKINESATKLIDTIMESQIILKKKMECALNALPKPCPEPCPPCPEQKSEKNYCTILYQNHKHSAVFTTKQFNWCCGSALSLCKQSTCCVGIDLPPSRDTEILLMNCSKFIVNFNLEFTPLSPCNNSVSIELKHICHLKTLLSEKYHASGSGNCISISGVTIIEAPRDCPHSYICIELVSPCNIQVKSGRISVVEI